LPEEEEKRRFLSADDDERTWAAILKEAVHILVDEGIPYLAFGSIATVSMGYEESCSDIDLLVSRDDADRALKAFEKAGYTTEKSDPEWLYKAVKDRVLVDIIFRVGDRNEIRPDDEMFRRAKETYIKGELVKVASPEDFLVMQALSNKQEAPDYWFKGLKAAAHEGIDWGYVVHRARISPLRVLSLLIYARAEGNPVPKEVLDALYASVG
jgi:hypothetical protein